MRVNSDSLSLEERGRGLQYDPARLLTHRVLPVLGVVFLVLGALRLWLEDRGAIDRHEGVLFMTLLAFGATAALSFWSAREIRRVGLTRRRADAIAHYRDFAHNVADASVFVFDHDLRYLVAESRLLEQSEGIKPSSMIGRTIYEVIPPETVEVIEPAYLAALEGRSTMLETSFQGEHYWVHALPLREDGTILGGLVITQRITERKRLEADLLQAQKMDAVGQLAGGIAHDFNNLLTAITGFAELKERRDGLDPYVTEIRRAADRAAALTTQLLAFSRRQLVAPRALDVNEVIGDNVSLLERVLGANVDLVTDLTDEPTVVRIDSAQINQVLMNLVINARDAMPAGGRLVIETRLAEIQHRWDMPQGSLEAGPYVRLTVSDTGVGIDAQTLPQVFDSFFTTKQIGHGTGLGLSTVYGVAAQSGGTVHVYSSPGDGTAFHVYLPRCHGDPGAHLYVRAEEAELDVKGLKVLLVEDDALVRQVLVEMLTQLGFEVDAVGDAETAAEFQRGDSYQLLVTDYLLPKMNGRELTTRLAATNPQLKTIFISGYTGHTVAADADLGEMTFLQKPFGASDLAAKLQNALND